MADVHLPDLDGFDPLSENLHDDAGEKSIFEAATKRVVQNILKSYTGYFDLFSELLQNSLDAIDARTKFGDPRAGRIWVDIDIPNEIVRVTDNGTGMTQRELRYCLRPSVSFKNRKESRGHKGVGATFLAYGFASIALHTKSKEGLIAVQLDGGRTWADDFSGTHARPKFATVDFDEDRLDDQPTGTAVKIRIGTKNRPNLGWWNATTAPQWLDMLRIKTPLGGVYINGGRPKINVVVTVIDNNGSKSTVESDSVEYLWPHDLTSVLPKTQDIGDIQKAISKCDGDMSRIPADFKNLSAIYNLWDCNGILDSEDGHWNNTFTPEEEQLIRQHDMAVYACFVSSAKSWTEYHDEHLRVRKGHLLLKGGLQIASDHMVQGDMSVIPLTSTIGYQANTHVVIHFRDGNPDMGRKVFQPELKSLAEKTSRHVVSIFKRYLHLMREDTGSPTYSDTTGLFEWAVREDNHQRAKPFEFRLSDTRPLGYVAEPRSEQDVIALFHEAVGARLFLGLQFVGTSGIDKYDSCYRVFNEQGIVPWFDKNKSPFGVRHAPMAKPTSPLVLEYKYDLDGLVADFETEIKYPADIRLVVCWSIGSAYQERYRLVSYLVGDEGSARETYGSTHALYTEKEKRFEIIALKDFFDFLRNPDDVIAAHQTRFKL